MSRPKSDPSPPAVGFFRDEFMGCGMHYYQFNIGDYKSHTEHLSEMEDLTYRRLLDWYYLHESPLPLDITEVARQIRMRSHSDCIATVLHEYFEKTDDGWIHHRANKEIAKAGDKSSKASMSAKVRWSKKTNKNKDLGSHANALQTQSEGNATHNTLHITQDTEHKKKATVVAAPVGVSQSVWDDFVKHRKAKKAQVTQTVIDGITKEAQKAGWSLDDALKEAILRNWQSFKADWVTNKSFAFQDIARVTVPGSTGPDPALVKIQQDRLKAVPPSIEQLEKMAQLRRSMK